MDKNWFPFFSMMFWFVTKVIGLVSFLYGAYALAFVFTFGEGWFGRFLFSFGLPAALGFVLLATDLVHDLATAAMRGRQPAT